MEGISPDNRLLERLSEFRLINPPISNGMSPVSLLLDKSKPTESVDIENSSRGMPPYKLLEERLSVVSCLQPSKLRYEPGQIIFLEPGVLVTSLEQFQAWCVGYKGSSSPGWGECRGGRLVQRGLDTF